MPDMGDIIVGIGLIIVGALLLLGEFGLGVILPYLGLVLIVAGILVLVGVIPGGLLIGVAVLVVGILLQFHWITADWVADVMPILNLVLGILLVVLGILKLLGR